MKLNELPLHNLPDDKFVVCVEDIGYQNPFDFTKRHRHNYFEILFFEVGGGSQLIDFIEYPILDNSCYIIFPNQVHLLKKNDKTKGNLIQFKEENISSVEVNNSLHLSFSKNNSPIIFENDQTKIVRMKAFVQLLAEIAKDNTSGGRQIAIHTLQALLLQILDLRHADRIITKSRENQLLLQFHSLLESQFAKNKSVSEYVQQLNTTDKKLSVAVKKHFGTTPLQIIHNRIILEVKRILLFENVSHKEVAYRLGFDSPATYTQFVKAKTGYSPTKLYEYLAETHR